MADYQIMADATVDFPEGLEQTLGITIIPMIVEMGGQDYTICGKDSEISPLAFYEHLDKGEVARTAQVTSTLFYQYFEEEFKKGRDVILISFSSGLSKSFEASLVCAEKMKTDYPDRKLYCIDSLCASGGHGLLVYTAVQKQRQGMTVDELASWLQANATNMAHWVTVDELNTLLRGGRISKTSATVGTMLNIKPIIHIDGEGHLIAVNKVRGRKKSMETLAQMLRENRTDGPDDPVFIGYGKSLEDANYLRDLIMADGGPQDVRLLHVGPVIGAHTGPSVVAAFFFGDRKFR